ncbi:DNA polymerase IV [Corynebacterium choanae]|uniref:DNA polymerase IV n=1 Tax=Corynebacterium choanae TaxID=1862358 RepID=A0A3G6J7Z1_9CORY|nr:DNA polymerase IV [Corynebacterium choanae]AZA13932.1 DNA polymerase IV [Corynebacterium choanae]
MSRWVVHIDMDAFFASCEQLTRPTLQGRPVLVGGVHGRGVVAGCSYEARALGAHSAQPMVQARACCGLRAVTVAPRKPVYSVLSHRIFQLLAERYGVIEQLSVDEAFIEPPALQQATVAAAAAFGDELRDCIATEVGLPASVGIGPGKQLAKIASGLAKPAGTAVIAQQDLATKVWPLPVTALWGVGPVAAQKLAAHGVATIGQFAGLRQSMAATLVGSSVGRQLWEFANGVDNRPVVPRAMAKQVSQEHTYPTDIITDPGVREAVDRAFAGAYRRLVADGRGAKTVTVKQKRADFSQSSRSQSLTYATDDRQTLRNLAHAATRPIAETGPIRLVGVSFSGLDAAVQDVFFPELDQLRSAESQVETYEAGVRGSSVQESLPGSLPAEGEMRRAVQPGLRFQPTADVFHLRYGSGWVQGIGHGVVTVRFESRTTGPGRVRSFEEDDPLLVEGDPFDCLDWDESMIAACAEQAAADARKQRLQERAELRRTHGIVAEPGADTVLVPLGDASAQQDTGTHAQR